MFALDLGALHLLRLMYRGQTDTSALIIIRIHTQILREKKWNLIIVFNILMILFQKNELAGYKALLFCVLIDSHFIC